MGQTVNLTASDGHHLDGYMAIPKGQAIGALVVVQEIFGVNKTIRSFVDDYAKEGFVAIAPALFDRFERNLELGYDEEDTKKAFGLFGKLDTKTALLDVAAAFAKVSEPGKSVCVLGFCYGGLLSWLSATQGEDLRMRPACTVGYYPGGIGKFAAEQPSCPVLLHFGGNDSHIGKEQYDAVRTAHPDVEVCVYEGAEHAFANFSRFSYKADAAKLANQRSLEFLREHIV